MSNHLQSETELARSLSPFKLFAIAFGSIVGVGWMTLVGIWLGQAGPIGAILGFAMGCVAVSLIAVAYAELSLMIPQAGAEVAYADTAFGPGLAFAVGWLLLLVYAAVIAFEMISVGWIAGVIWPGLRGEGLWTIGGQTAYAGELALGLVVAVFITAANIRAADLAASAQAALMVIKVAVSAVFIAVALFSGDAANLTPGFAADPEKALSGILWMFAVSLLFYGGFNFLLQGMEERAASTQPRQILIAMFASLLLAFVFYALVILGTGMVLPRRVLMALDLPAAAAFEVAFGSHTLRNVVLAAGLLGLLTAWNGTLFAATRIVLLLGRKNLLPPVLGRVKTSFRTPVAAIVAVAAVSTILGLCGRTAVIPIVSVVATGIPLSWAIVAAAAWRLRRRAPDALRPFCAPYGRVVFAAGFVVACVAAVIAGSDAVSGDGQALGVVVLGGWSLLGILIWAGFGRLRGAAA